MNKQQYQANNQQGDYSNNVQGNPNNNQVPINVKREIQISQATKEKADAFRVYIESIIASKRRIIIKFKGKYSKKKQEEKEKKENWDMFQKKMDDLKISLPEQELIKREILHKEAQQMRDK